MIGTVERWPANLSSLIRFLPAEITAGMRVARYGIAMFALADLLWSTGIESVEPARDVR